MSALISDCADLKLQKSTDHVFERISGQAIVIVLCRSRSSTLGPIERVVVRHDAIPTVTRTGCVDEVGFTVSLSLLAVTPRFPS